MAAFVAGALATWRIANLFVNELGPYEIFSRLRRYVGVRYNAYSRPYGTNEISKAFACIWCLSIWAGLLIAIVTGPRRIGAMLVNGLAYSTVAVIVNRLIGVK